MPICPKQIIVLFLFINSIAFAQTSPTKQQLAVMFYNVENLFDTIDDPHKTDNEFLPLGKNEWNGARLRKKLNNLSSVIIAAGKGSMPDLIGVSEVETGSCLQLLTKHSSLSAAKYEYIHFESPDTRGIDVGLLYNPKTVTPIKKQAISIHFPQAPNDKTRDILYVSAKTKLFDTMHILVVHLPSRRGGKKKSDEKRQYVASIIKKTTDSIFQTNKNAAIIIMGDFNDRPTDPSILVTLQAQYNLSQPQSKTLYGLLQESEGEGSYKFQGRWQEIDHFFVSGAILNQKFHCSARFVREDFMLQPDGRNAGMKPFRTYNGPRYEGGYSDHLPIYLQIKQQ